MARVKDTSKRRKVYANPRYAPHTVSNNNHVDDEEVFDDVDSNPSANVTSISDIQDEKSIDFFIQFGKQLERVKTQLESAERMNPNTSTIRTVRDLSSIADEFGQGFGEYINQVFDVASINIDIGKERLTDTNLFGKLIDKLVVSYIRGTKVSKEELGDIRFVNIIGINEVDSPTELSFQSNERSRMESTTKPTTKPTVKPDTEKLVDKRKTIGIKRKIHTLSVGLQRSRQFQYLSEQDILHQLDELQENVLYDEAGNIDKKTKNIPIRLQYGSCCVSVKELARLLLARPWIVLVQKMFPFRILKTDAFKDESFKKLSTMVNKYLVDMAMARWEREFWIELPKCDNPIDQTFVETYKTARDVRRVKLSNIAKNIKKEIDMLTYHGFIPPFIEHDPAFQRMPDNQVSWLPTREDLFFDMAIRAARDPSRFYFVFNPATHRFYKEHYNLLFPPADSSSLNGDVPDEISNLFSQDFNRRHGIDDALIKNVEQQWDYYQTQLMKPIKESSIPEAYFPMRHLFKEWNPKQFKHTRCMYFDPFKDKFLEEPHDPDDFDHVYKIADKDAEPTGHWIAQPVTNHSIKQYVYENGGNKVTDEYNEGEEKDNEEDKDGYEVETNEADESDADDLTRGNNNDDKPSDTESESGEPETTNATNFEIKKNTTSTIKSILHPMPSPNKMSSSNKSSPSNKTSLSNKASTSTKASLVKR